MFSLILAENTLFSLISLTGESFQKFFPVFTDRWEPCNEDVVATHIAASRLTAGKRFVIVSHWSSAHTAHSLSESTIIIISYNPSLLFGVTIPQAAVNNDYYITKIPHTHIHKRTITQKHTVLTFLE